MLSHRILLLLISGGTSVLFPIVAVLISIATHRCASSLVSIPSPTRTVFCSVVAAVLTGGRRSRVVLIVCISPMTGDLSTVFRGVRGNWGLHKQLFHARVCAALRTIRDKCWSSPHTPEGRGRVCGPDRPCAARWRPASTCPSSRWGCHWGPGSLPRAPHL